MKTILDTIVDFKKEEIKQLKKRMTIKDFESFPFYSAQTLSISEHIEQREFGIIAEIKRKSPSAGKINLNIDICEQAREYELGNAAAISVLTDHSFFGGSIKDLSDVKSHASIPVLRKEFIIDEFQLFEAKANGADAILLISEILEEQQALEFTIMAQSLGMEVIMEAHDQKHLERINDEVNIIGINNRNLHLQITDLQTSKDLYPFIPTGKLSITESGITSYDEALELSKVGYSGALIGEAILKKDHPQDFLNSLSLKQSSLC